ncbi:MAG TPA: adenylate/guanylate cyclase domain-containing protein [Gaiellaceae bacterium]|jgi:adenylate cyclase|nr:adenylate/guanylate cyclase domain-containing protein [Gaiellaceae bacterium]
MAKLTVDEMWERMVTGTFPRLQRMRQIWGLLPSPPRCKLCNAPFRGPGGVLMRALAYGPSTLNRRLCRWCIRAVHKHPGGAEVEISVLFADVRGSTALAERMPPEEFSRLMARFYGAVAGVIDERDGIVDKFVGDGAVALFIPGFAGSDHAADAIAAARDLLAQTGNDGPQPWIPVGAAVHTGRSFVGSVGEGDARDFTALGDTVNTVARLTSLAGAGELLISAEAAGAGGLETDGLERRTLELRGRDQTVDAWVAGSRR